MHIVELDIPISISHAIEATVVLTITEGFIYTVTKMRSVAANAEAKGGRVRPETLPTSFSSRIVTQIHTLAMFIPPLVYVGAVVFNGFRQPDWMVKFALSDEIVGLKWKNVLRVTACSTAFAVRSVANHALAHLGEQWHPTGRREKPRVVQTGPYAIVRHPLFSAALFQELMRALMFWSYVPLFSFGIIAGMFAIKVPIEETAIQQDAGTRDEYRAYMKKVPARFIPNIW
ncbi:hypothetical protein BDN67DRAFT_935984 [Paxillus ammoniavirescens]|nr:hypothetical protein BDN67DRAFT_935984 [Paxillus ammoniavirescens]